MDRICPKCGNLIPQGTDACPTCDQDLYNEEALQDVLSGISGGAIQPEQPEDIPEIPEVPAEPAEAENPIPPQEPQSAVQEILHPAGEPEPESPAGAVRRKNTAPAQRPKRRRPEGERSNMANTQNNRKKHMKKRSAAAVGVLIGLIVALLVVGIGVIMMLRQLGFFTPMSDEELLATTMPAPAAATAPVEQQEPEPVPEVSEEPAAPEEQQEPETAKEPEPSPTPDLTASLERFELTSDETIILYSRGGTEEVPYVLEPETLKSYIDWTSDDETIAVVEDGVIQARRGGNCTVTGTIGDATISVDVYCAFEVPVTVLDMNMEDITMSYEGQTVELFIDYDLDEYYVENTVWESSDPDVATVNEKGVVTAVSDGTTVITASLQEYTASCIVRCVGVSGNRGYNNSQSEYVINYEDVTLTRKGEYFQLSLTSVIGGDVPKFTWSSDDNSVATVDSKGIVTAVANGTANITASVGDDDFRCIVRVNIS